MPSPRCVTNIIAVADTKRVIFRRDSAEPRVARGVRWTWSRHLTSENELLAVKDSSRLTDADWAEINNMRRLYRHGGVAALDKRLVELSESNPVLLFRVIGAFCPTELPEVTKDALAEMGLTEEDIREELATWAHAPNRKH